MIDWGSEMVGSITEQFSFFQNIINSIYCRSFPLKIKYISRKRLKNRWITRGILKSIETKSILFKMLKLGNITKRRYNLYNNKLKIVTSEAKKLYYSAAFDNNRDNMRRTWRLVKELSGRTSKSSTIESIVIDNERVTDKVKIADAFNEYYSNIAIELDSNIPDSNISPLHAINFTQSGSFF